MGSRVGTGLALTLLAATAVADVTDERHYSYELADGGRISLENVNGDVTVTGSSGNQVEITALMKAGSQDYLDGMEIVIKASEDAIRIETKHPRSTGGWFGRDSSGSVTYTLSVPAGAELDSIESVNGNIEIRGVGGAVKSETVNGDIDAFDLGSDVRLETVNGSVDATFVTLGGSQKVQCETVNGRLTLNFPANANATVSAETVNGGIDGDDFGLKTSKGFIGRDLEGAIGDGTARVSLSTVNGGIRIRKG